MWERVKEIIGKDIDQFEYDIIGKARNNDLQAIFKLGRLYEQGLKIKRNDEKSVQLFQICSENGIVDSKIRLADKMFMGEGISKDIKKAKELLEDGIESKKIMAFMLLGDINVKEGNLSEAILNYSKAEEIFKMDKQNVDEYTMAIMYGDLARIYLSKNKNVYNPLKAIEYVDKALEGDVYCNAKEIGDLYYYGIGVNKDLKKAEFYYKRVADEEMCNECPSNCNNYCRDQLYRIWRPNPIK